MTKEERQKLHRDLAESYERFNKAFNNWVETPSADNIEQLKKVDEEYKSQNKKLWDWLDM